MNAKTTYYATRDFKDAGTEREFTGGKEMPADVTDGQMANYAHAKLVTTDKPKAPPVSTDKASA